jgi:hypothetical protein
MLKRMTLTSLTLGVVTASAAVAQSDILVELQDFTPREYRAQGFVLTGPQTLRIQAVGAEPGEGRGNRFDWRGDDADEDTWPAAAWILDAATREVVWDLRTARTDRDRSGLRRYTGEVRLPAGTYIAHYGSFPARGFTTDGIAGLRWIRGGDGRDLRYLGPYVENGEYREFGFTVRGAGRVATAGELDGAAATFSASSVVTVRPERAKSRRVGFALRQATDLEVYAIGEMNEDGDYDYAWIADAETGARVWRMDYRSSDHAGGAHKNRLVRERVRLPAGRYVAYAVADDSHDPEEWNTVPPVDPAFWGLTLRVADPAARAAVELFAYEPVPQGQSLVALTGIGDDEMRSEGFTLTRPMEVRIYALGEGRDGRMYDYGWILNATTRQRVWTMRYEDTEHAGGGQKNRIFQGTLRLEPGSYLVFYRSDDSHSADDWNDSPPAEPRYWGISLYPASGRLDRDAVAPYVRGGGRDADLIAEIPRVGDDERARATFRLDTETTVRIYALGEGSGQMFDYAWLEDARGGRVVWEMTYRTSQHAGGAEKNRVYDGQVRLGPGEYVLRYRSDGSHSYGDWNSDPPDDPEGWGVAVYRVR